MNKHVAGMIDRYALWLLHREKSRSPQFAAAALPLVGRDFYFQPGIPEISFEQQNTFSHYTSGQFQYRSEVDTGLAGGVFFHSGRNDQKTSVILVHGWRQDHKRIQEIYQQALLERGYDLYFYTLPHHGERQDEQSAYNGEYMVSAHRGRTAASFRQAVVDIRALAGWLKKQRSDRVILAGISLGGLVVNLVCTAEEQIDGVISVFAPNSLAYSVWHTIPGKYIKQELGQNGVDYEQLQTDWAMMDTAKFKMRIPQDKILMIAALYDRYIDLRDVDTLWAAWNRPERKLYPCGHAGIVFCKERICWDSLAFIERHGW